MVSADRGVLYIAFGESYRQEARRSIGFLRKVSPGVAVAVITDQEWTDEPRPDTFLLRPKEESFGCKPLYMSDAPFPQTLYLDTDTVVARDITPIFGLLKHYDIGVRFWGPQLNEPDGLELHTQCSSSVVLFRGRGQTRDVFEKWRAEFDRARSNPRIMQGVTDSRGLADQRYLAIAIAKSSARPVHLAEYLNFVVFNTEVTYSPPLIFSGRIPGMETLDRQISGSWDATIDYHPRLWLPNIRGLLPAGIRRSDPLLALALVLRRGYNAAVMALRRFGRTS